MILLALFGLTLLLPSLAERLTRPLVALGSRLSTGRCFTRQYRRSAGAGRGDGPVVGALCGPDPGPDPHWRGHSRRQRQHPVLLLAYALGAATSLAAALLIGGKLFAGMKKSLGATNGYAVRWAFWC
jgi:hypothetical protein